LLTGSKGTLCVITEASVAVGAILRSGVLPATLEFLDNTCLIAVDDFAHLGLDRQAGALLLFGDDGALGLVEESVQRIALICSETSGAV
jgi:glycolate oxidase